MTLGPPERLCPAWTWCLRRTLVCLTAEGHALLHCLKFSLGLGEFGDPSRVRLGTVCFLFFLVDALHRCFSSSLFFSTFLSFLVCLLTVPAAAVLDAGRSPGTLSSHLTPAADFAGSLDYCFRRRGLLFFSDMYTNGRVAPWGISWFYVVFHVNGYANYL